MPFPSSVAEQSLLACERHCCICHKFCGTKIECHHIVQEADGGANDADNCIPLCFDCHADVENYNPHHPKGRKFSPSELKGHRDRWFSKVGASGGVIANQQYLDVDRQMFAIFRSILPSDGSVDFLRHHDFGGSFSWPRLDQLKDFVRWAGKPEVEFFDSDIEASKSNLAVSAKAFLMLLVANSWEFDNDATRATIPPEWRHKRPDRYNEVINEVHSTTDAICQKYDDMIRLSRRKLAVL